MLRSMAICLFLSLHTLLILEQSNSLEIQPVQSRKLQGPERCSTTKTVHRFTVNPDYNTVVMDHVLCSYCSQQKQNICHQSTTLLSENNVLIIHESSREGARGTQIELDGEELRNLCPIPNKQRKTNQGEFNSCRKGACGRWQIHTEFQFSRPRRRKRLTYVQRYGWPKLSVVRKEWYSIGNDKMWDV
jgi:hypothetical protein